MIDYSIRGIFQVDITDYAGAIKENFSLETNKTLEPWNDKLF